MLKKYIFYDVKKEKNIVIFLGREVSIFLWADGFQNRQKERMLKLKILLNQQQDGRKTSAIIERKIFGILLRYFHIWNPFYTSMANRVYSKHIHQGKSLDKFPSLTNSLRSTYPMISYLFFAWSISMRSVA